MTTAKASIRLLYEQPFVIETMCRIRTDSSGGYNHLPGARAAGA